jgi:AraC family transcriptional activator of pobA
MTVIPSYALYGENHDFPDVLHCERIFDRAKGLDWIIAPHRHAQLHQFFLITHGSTQFSIDGETRDLMGPAMLSVPAFHVHGFHFSPNTQGYVLSCPTREIDTLIGQDIEIQATLKTAFQGTPTDQIRTQFDYIYDEFCVETTLRTPMLRSLLRVLLCHIARNANDVVKAGDQKGIFQKFERLLIENPQKPINIDQFASDLGVSRTGLHRACHAATGQSAQRVAMQTKIQEAKRRLAYTQEPASQIAYRLGFEDPSYFSKVFRSYAGVTPTQYRARFETGLEFRRTRQNQNLTHKDPI